MSKLLFHELPQSEVDSFIENKMTVGELMDKYDQPTWCTYHKALSMTWGCWTLCDLQPNGGRTKISEKFCSDCECFKMTTP